MNLNNKISALESRRPENPESPVIVIGLAGQDERTFL